MKLRNKAFTITELLVVIAIIGILVLFGLPRFLGYVQKARLTRIKHDVKVMETMMEDELARNLNKNYDKFTTNEKDLGLLLEADRLFEKEGPANNLQYVPSNGEIDGLNNSISLGRKENLSIGGPLMQTEEEYVELYERYKIIPEEYKTRAGTRLKGTFYSNPQGKVYYESGKSEGQAILKKPLACSMRPLPEYDFDYKTGTIIKYLGSNKHLTIPSYFLVEGKCWPVKIIGKGAFLQGSYKTIKIPSTVEIIEENAFKDNNLETITIPGSVTEVQNNAFDGNKEVIYEGSYIITKSINNNEIENGSVINKKFNDQFEGLNYLSPSGSTKEATCETPSPKDLGLVFNPTQNKIIKGGVNQNTKENLVSTESLVSTPSINKETNNIGYIPPYINVDGKDLPVKQLAKGSYQGMGLITVQLPDTLEVIEDYTFAGNQLIDVNIPNNVKKIGNYAFAFNEITQDNDISTPTISSIIIKNEEQFAKVNNDGDISNNGVKIEEIKQGDKSTSLLDNIWVTTRNNHIIDEAKFITKEIENKKPEEVDMGGSGIDPETGKGSLDGACGATKFITNSGITITSTSPVYCNKNYYNMSNLFDGLLSDDSAYGNNNYWLTSTSGRQDLTFDFGKPAKVKQIDVAPRTRSDHFTDFRIVASNDGENWTVLTNWFITSKSIPASHIESYEINQVYQYYRFELKGRGPWGVSLAEVKFYQ